MEVINVKNIQIIDGAINTKYAIYEISENIFNEIFPNEHQDVEFAEDVVARLGEKKASQVFSEIWKKRMNKPEIIGLHGTLFFESQNKKKFYPKKRETDLENTKFIK